MEKFNKIIDILKSKWLKNTGRTAILIAAIIVIFLGINVLMLNLDIDDLDFTSDQLYSLTDESKERIASLPKDDKIQIYMFDYKEKDTIVEFAKQYTKINENITVEVISVDDRPDIASKYNVESGFYTVIVVSGEKHKTFTSYDFYTQDYNTGDSVDITEQRLTNAIIAISSVGKTTPVYMLSGHGEKSVETDMIYYNTYLELENYEVKSLDLLSAQKVPDDCTSLIIASPTKDFTELEANAIKEYINKGGNILWLSDPYSGTTETPYINSILEMYGVNVRQDGVIWEQDSSKMAMGNPFLVIPEIENSPITDGISSALLLSTGKLEFQDDKKLEELGVTKTNLLRTSEKSFFRTNIEASELTPIEGEKEEAAVAAAILEKKVSDDDKESSKLVVFANNIFATDRGVYVGASAMPAIGFYDNKDLIINATQYVSEVEDTMAIRKTVEVTRYTATETQDRIIKIIIFALPVVIIILGIIIWQLRRRKK